MLNVMDFSCSDPLYSKYEESCEMKAGDLQGLGQPEQQLLEEAEFLGGKGRAGGTLLGLHSSAWNRAHPLLCPSALGCGSGSAQGGGGEVKPKAPCASPGGGGGGEPRSDAPSDSHRAPVSPCLYPFISLMLSLLPPQVSCWSTPPRAASCPPHSATPAASSSRQCRSTPRTRSPSST